MTNQSAFFVAIAISFLFLDAPPIVASDLPRPTEVLALSLPDDIAATDKCRLIVPQDLQLGRKVVLGRSFLDDFDVGTEPNVGWMRHYYRPNDPNAAHTHGVSDEQEVYVDKDYAGTGGHPLGLDPFEVKGGILTIIAFRTPEEDKAALFLRPYVSGMLNSRDLFAQIYGYFEIAAKLPIGSPVWPAFWLVPRDKPSPPELDVLEMVGKEPEHIYQTTHWKYPNGHTSCQTEVKDLSYDFHLYGALWTLEYIIYYVDRKPVNITSTPVSMNNPMYMIINIGVGGAWPGYVNATTASKFEMQVDWVAAYIVR